MVENYSAFLLSGEGLMFSALHHHLKSLHCCIFFLSTINRVIFSASSFSPFPLTHPCNTGNVMSSSSHWNEARSLLRSLTQGVPVFCRLLPHSLHNMQPCSLLLLLHILQKHSMQQNCIATHFLINPGTFLFVAGTVESVFPLFDLWGQSAQPQSFLPSMRLSHVP